MPSIINSDDGVVSGTSGLKTTGGNDGILSIQNNGTTNVTVTAAGNAGFGTSSPVTLKSARTLQVLGNAKLGDANDRGLLSLGDTGSTGANCGIWRGAAGAYGSAGNYLSLGGYDGITFTTGNADIASQTERMRIDSSGRVTTPNQPAFNASGAPSDSTTGAGVALPFSVLNNGIVGSARSSNYNTSTYRFTAPVAGLYFFAVAIFDASGSAYAQVSPYKNGAVLNMTDQLLAFTTAGVGSEMQTGSFLLDLAVNDYVDIRPRAGYSIKMFGGHSFFTGFLIG